MLPHFSVGWYKDTPRRGLATVDDLVDTEAEVSVARTTDVFPQSIASGGPTPTGVVLWTRIALDHYDPSETLRVKVAPDPSMDDTVVRAELPGPGVEATDNYRSRGRRRVPRARQRLLLPVRNRRHDEPNGSPRGSVTASAVDSPARLPAGHCDRWWVRYTRTTRSSTAPMGVSRHRVRPRGLHVGRLLGRQDGELGRFRVHSGLSNSCPRWSERDGRPAGRCPRFDSGDASPGCVDPNRGVASTVTCH